jgi:Na+/proline symporter
MIGSETFLVLLWMKVVKMPIAGIHNGVWAMIFGVILFVVVSLLTKPVDEKTIEKFFGAFKES